MNENRTIAESKIYCQCLKCHKVFEYKERATLKGEVGFTSYVCPICMGKFKFIKTPFDYYLDKFLFINDDPKYYR